MEEGGGSDGPPAIPAGEAKTEVPRKDDVVLLADEKFDFDLSLSSLSANEDEEVFFGPVGHKERCIAASLDLSHPSPAGPPLPAGSPFRWSPLAGEKFVEVYTEARLLALQIESSSWSAGAQAGPQDPGSQGVERFIQESRLKMTLFDKENETKRSPSSLKRETYCLGDSPAQGLPLPGTQPPSGAGPPKAPAQAGPAPTQGPPLTSRPSVSVEPSLVHPRSLAVTQKKVVSRLLPPRASSVRGKSTHWAAEKPPKEKPASPSRTKSLNDKEPDGARPPDKPRTARDATSLLASGSRLVQDKHSLPVPSKPGLKKTLLRPPGRAGGLPRRPCSRGSVSSVGTGVGTSPAAGRDKSSERPGVSADSSRPPPNPSQSGRAGAPTARPALQVGPTAVCGQSRCPGRAEPTAERPTAPITLAVTQPHTPEQGGARPTPRPSLSRSAQLSRTGISRTAVLPTPTSQFRIPRFPTGEPPDGATPSFSRAQRPQPCTPAGRVAHSTPARRSSGPAVRTPVSTRRTSCLPTPASRRLSGLPLATPKTVPRMLASPPCVSARWLFSEPRKESAGRTAPGRGSSLAAPRGSDASSPEGVSPPAAVPQALSFSPDKSDHAVSQSGATEPALDAGQPPAEAAPREAVLVDIQLDPPRVTPRPGRPLGDLPLIDLSVTPEASVGLGSESRPLIDLLVNTPDAGRGTASKVLPEEGQLIDLCSPLIQLSPEADKENMDSPLLKF